MEVMLVPIKDSDVNQIGMGNNNDIRKNQRPLSGRSGILGSS
jgi:hypothetical protein